MCGQYVKSLERRRKNALFYNGNRRNKHRIYSMLIKNVDCSNERILEDIIFNQLENLRDEIQKICVVEE